MPGKITGPPAAETKLGAGHQRNIVHAAEAGVAEAQVVGEIKSQRKPRPVKILQAKAERNIERGFADPLAELVVEAKSRKAEAGQQIRPPAGIAQRIIEQRNVGEIVAAGGKEGRSAAIGQVGPGKRPARFRPQK